MLSQSNQFLRAAQQTVVMYLKRKCQYIAVGQRSQVQTGLTSSKPHVGELVNHALKLYWPPIKLFFQQTSNVTFPRGTSVCLLCVTMIQSHGNVSNLWIKPGGICSDVITHSVSLICKCDCQRGFHCNLINSMENYSSNLEIDWQRCCRRSH